VGAESVWVARLDEAEAVADLLVQFRDHMGRDWPSANAFLAGVEKLMERPDVDYLLGAPHDDAPPAGVAQLRYRYGIWLAGEALVEATLKRARERGCRRVELDVSDGNPAAFALYERFGFSTGKAEGTRDLFMGRRLEDAR